MMVTHALRVVIARLGLINGPPPLGKADDRSF